MTQTRTQDELDKIEGLRYSISRELELVKGHQLMLDAMTAIELPADGPAREAALESIDRVTKTRNHHQGWADGWAKKLSQLLDQTGVQL